MQADANKKKGEVDMACCKCGAKKKKTVKRKKKKVAKKKRK